MTTTERIRVESMIEYLSEYGIDISFENATSLVNDFMLGLSNEMDMQAIRHIQKNQVCEKCKSLEAEIKDLKSDIEVYKNSVKKRRNAEHVYIENGSVKYDLI